MIVGGYTLDLYCDIKNNDHKWNEFPHQITGESRSECYREARKRGWKLKRDGTALCPLCSKKARVGFVRIGRSDE